jgi:Glycosyltransferase family 87
MPGPSAARRLVIRTRAPRTALSGHEYLYGPIFALTLRPLTRLDIANARFIWFLAQAIALLGLVTLSIRESGSSVAWRWWGVVLLCALTARPTHDDMTLGQIGIFLALVLVASFAACNRHPPLAGSLLAFATAVKFSPALLWVGYLCEKRWSVLSYTVATTAFLFALTLVLCGFGVHAELVDTLLSGARYPLLAEHNDSIQALWLRLFTANRFVHPLFDCPLLAGMLIVGSTVGVLIVCVWFTRAGEGLSNFNLWSVALLLLYPASGLYTLVLLILPMLTILHALESHREPALWLPFMAALGLLYLPPMNSLVRTEALESPWMAIAFAPPTFAVMLAFVSCAILAAQTPQPRQ